jgi:fido (protein-threonine AMPylation protein)
MTSSDGGTRYEYANGVLRNKLGVQDAEELRRIEATYTTLRIAQLDDQPIVGSFDLEHLKAVHRHIFQDVYSWAGDYAKRTHPRMERGLHIMRSLRATRVPCSLNWPPSTISLTSLLSNSPRGLPTISAI